MAAPPPPAHDVRATAGSSAAQPEGHEDSGSGSELELDSPPRVTFFALPEQEHEPGSPTSPNGSPSPPPPSIFMKPAGSPKSFSSDEEDPYFESLVDNFASAAASTCSSTLSDDDIDYRAQVQRRCVLYAENALKHYNNDEKNEIKYELVSGITSSDIFVKEGYFGHVNFTAKGTQQKEEFFFAELRWDGDTLIPTCVVSLEGIEKVGGLCDTRYDKFYLDVLPIDKQHCYACNRRLKHPKDGKLYEMGHIAMSTYYM